MTSSNFNCSKSNSFLLSEQVKKSLYERGYSFLFNYNDYSYYKAKVKNAFNKAQAIADLFIKENINSKSDYNGYVF